MSTVYKIRRNDGLFSNGKTRPRFKKGGKIWNSLGLLKRHLSDMGAQNFDQAYNDCEIMEYVASQPISIIAVMREVESRKLELQQRRNERSERQRAHILAVPPFSVSDL